MVSDAPCAGPASGWQPLGRSVRGSAHVRAGRPNQDALALWPGEGDSHDCAIVAVADGHGGARHFRSDAGARLAVACAERALRVLAERLQAPCPSPAHAAERVQQWAEALPQQIVSDWVACARDDLAAHPIGAVEWQTLLQDEGERALASVQQDPLLAYGATLLAVLATPQLLLLLQLGDGDLLAVDRAGRPSRPLPADERLGGNLTTSICRPGAERDFRLAVLPLAPEGPALLLLSTDGYANSFATDEDFLQVGPDFLALTATHGTQAVGARLTDILQAASQEGSGDDITLGLLCRLPVPAPALAPSAAAQTRGQEDAQAQALQLARRQLRRWRAAALTLALGLVALAGWHWRSMLGEMGLRPIPALATPLPSPGPQGLDRPGEPVDGGRQETPPGGGSAPERRSTPPMDRTAHPAHGKAHGP